MDGRTVMKCVVRRKFFVMDSDDHSSGVGRHIFRPSFFVAGPGYIPAEGVLDGTMYGETAGPAAGWGGKWRASRGIGGGGKWVLWAGGAGIRHQAQGTKGLEHRPCGTPGGRISGRAHQMGVVVFGTVRYLAGLFQRALVPGMAQVFRSLAASTGTRQRHQAPPPRDERRATRVFSTTNRDGREINIRQDIWGCDYSYFGA